MEICQRHLPFKPWMEAKTRRLPGVQPVAPGEWLLRDDVFAAQMAYRDRLITTRRAEIFQADAESHALQAEVLALVLDELDSGYQKGTAIMRPDGVAVGLEGPPLLVAARLVQEDLLIMDMRTEPRLVAGVLCFPASWTLAEKFGQGLAAIHGTVDDYTPEMAKRVGRMFEAMRAGHPLWRANFLRYRDAELFQPLGEGRHKPAVRAGGFVRIERQTLRKLPRSGAVVFGIHTYVFPWNRLNGAEQKAFTKAHP